MDSATAAFRAASGATDTVVIDQLVKFLKGQGLWTSVRFFPFKSGQNAGSGTTVYGLGGWTSNNVVVAGGPTWSSTGLIFDAVNDYGSVTLDGIEALAEMSTFDRQHPVSASVADTNTLGILSIGDNNIGGLGTEKFMINNVVSSLIAGETLCLGVTNVADGRRAGSTTFTWASNESVQIVTTFKQSGSGLWKSKTSKNLDVTSGTQDFRPSQSGWVIDSILQINNLRSNGIPSVFIATKRVCLLACKSALTTLQRETITDYIDAL